MASHVVVTDSTARRHVVKTTPGKHLSDILQETCTKLGLNPSLYELKHNNKALDLSLTFRLSGLTSGAKLSLVQGSRSPSVVSIALQLEDGSRVTDRVPSNTSIWQILRRFEAQNPLTPNLTQRATPQTSSGTASGSGRLYYYQPVIRAMNRELSSFVDLQKTLGQLGLTSGSILLRLSYQNTQQPLEEAMVQISEYFKETQEPVPARRESKSTGAASSPPAANGDAMEGVATTANAPPVQNETTASQDTANGAPEPSALTETPTLTSKDTTTPSAAQAQQPAPIAIFAPPTTATPSAAAAPTTDSDYEPTVDHAKAHQARLLRSSQNKRLKSDTELAADQRARAERLAMIQGVTVALKFPDESQARKECVRGDTVATLYATSRELMLHGDQPFSLRCTNAKGSLAPLTEAEGAKRLIEDLEWAGRVLVHVVWEAGASADARSRPSLKEAYRAVAQQLRVESVAAAAESAASTDKGKARETPKAGGSVADKETKLKKLFGLGKK